MTKEDSLSHAACKRTDTVFSYFTKPNFLSKLLHWLCPSSTSSPHFTRLSVLANSHLVHDMRGKTRKSQLSNGLSSAIRTLVFCSAESINSTLSFHFSHSHFHTTVGHVITLWFFLAESLPLLHMRVSPHLGVLSYSVRCRISK